jgi:hypothetical protein
VDRYLPYFRQWLITCPLSAHLPFQSLFTETLSGDQLFAPPPSVCSEHPVPSAMCSFSVPCLLFSFFVGQRSVCPGGSAGLSQGWLWENCVPLVCSPFGLCLQAGLEPASGSMGALLFSQCNVAWRSFVQAGDSGCWSFDSSWWFFSAKCGSSVSAKFLIYGAHAVCLCPLVTILDLLQLNLFFLLCRNRRHHLITK